MSEELLQPAIELFRNGNLQGAVEELDKLTKVHSSIGVIHHTYAEFANMLNTESQEDIVPGGKIMMSYKKAMQLDEENVEYIADFAAFALECRRVPVAVKEFQRYAKKLELEEIPVDEILYQASRNLVDAIEVMDPSRKASTVQPWLKQSLLWAIGGLGFSAEEALEILNSDE
jgi:hypothetical protein